MILQNFRYTIEIIDKHGNTSYREECMLYEAVLVPMTIADIQRWKEEKQLVKKGKIG